MRKNRIFKNEEPLKTIENNPFYAQNSKISVQSNLKSNANFSIIEKLGLKDLLKRQTRQSNFAQVIRLAYISANNQIHIDEEALYTLQRFTSTEIAFVGIYGQKGCGKSLLFDKILNLAGVEGSHYCRTSQNYQKGLYFYSLPFIKTSDIKVFWLDCVGFELTPQNESTREEEMLLDLMMILCSSVIVLPSPDDLKGNIFKNFYDRIVDSTERITENKAQTTFDKQYWPKNIYCLCRSKQKIGLKEEDLQKLFINYSYTIIYDALPDNLKNKGLTNQDLVQIQAIPENNMDQIHLNGLYVKQTSRLARQIMQKIYAKKYCDLKYNGNICCKLLLSLIKHLNKKESIKIDKIFLSILKELYQSAYQYHTQYYDQKLQQFFMQDDAYPLDYLLIAFQNCRESIVISFNELTMNDKMHVEYEEMLQRYIQEKQELILQINQKKTKFQLRNSIKSQINFPKNLTHKDQIFQFIDSLQNLQPQLDHDRCEIFCSTLIGFADDLQNKYLEDAFKKQQVITQDLRLKISKRKDFLEKDKEQNMKNIMLNTDNQNIYQNLLKENQSLDYKVKNTKKEIQIQKKFQKQFMANKEAAKQHAERLLAYIRELEEKSRDNQKIIDEINRQFDYNPTIQILNKRIQEKIRQQKQTADSKMQSQISQKHFKRRSQVRTIMSGSNISGIRSPSTIK